MSNMISKLEPSLAVSGTRPGKLAVMKAVRHGQSRVTEL